MLTKYEVEENEDENKTKTIEIKRPTLNLQFEAPIYDAVAYRPNEYFISIRGSQEIRNNL